MLSTEVVKMLHIVINLNVGFVQPPHKIRLGTQAVFANHAERFHSSLSMMNTTTKGENGRGNHSRVPEITKHYMKIKITYLTARHGISQKYRDNFLPTS